MRQPACRGAGSARAVVAMRALVLGLSLAGPSVWAQAPHFPSGAQGALIRQGWLIFTQTPKYASQFVGNKLSCSNCHLQAGTAPDAAPLWGAVPVYPRYQSKFKRVVTLEQRMQQCFEFSERGWQPPLDSQEILALSAYAHWVSAGRPLGQAPKGAGFAVLPPTHGDGDPLAGQAVYAHSCASCHGAQGQGLTQAGQQLFPPVWGLSSYAQGAGMSRPSVAARFIWANMPLGNAYSLTPQQAKDVAAFIDLQFRAPDPRKGLLGWLPH